MVQFRPYHYDIANSAPRPWDTGKVAAHGPYYVGLMPQIAAPIDHRKLKMFYIALYSEI